MTSTREHWEGVYRSRSPEQVSWYQRRPGTSLELIERAALHAPPGIIDVGGGASTLVDSLLEAGYGPLAVLDVSGSALGYSRRRLQAKARQVTWYESDIAGFEPSVRYGIWHDRAVFHFLVEETGRNEYVRCLEQTVAPGGWVIIAGFAPDGPERCSGLPVRRVDTALLQQHLGPAFQLQETRREIHVTPAGSEQRFLYAMFNRIGPETA